MILRFVTPQDCPALLDIYAQYIDTGVTFEYDLPTREEFTARISGICRDYPYLVCQEGDRVLGYAYAHRVWERAAYQWNAELSVYLDRAVRRRGLGQRLYGALMELLTMQGVLTAHALVTSPNPASQALHTAMGFRLLAVQDRAGYKNGDWHDVLWYVRELSPRGASPLPPVPLDTLPLPRVEAVLADFSGPLERP